MEQKIRYWIPKEQRGSCNALQEYKGKNQVATGYCCGRNYLFIYYIYTATYLVAVILGTYKLKIYIYTHNQKITAEVIIIMKNKTV